MKIFISAGEPSGDLHGANLIRDLQASDPTIEFVGLGGPRMRTEGCHLFHDMTQLAVMFVWNVLLNLHKFYTLYREAKQYFANHKIDAVVLIDYPGFNWWIAGIAKQHGVPVFYYGAPQMWAWASWRIKKMRRLVDHVLCKLPFEAKWYQQRNCNATYVGHPYFDELKQRKLDGAFLVDASNSDGALVTILPGSRKQEIQLNLRDFLKAAENINEQVPGTKFVVAAYNEEQAELVREIISESELKPTVHAGKTAELIEAADCCMACSGSVSLELLYHAKPSVILYRVSRFAFAVQNMLRKVKFVTLVNLLAADDPFGPSLALFDPTAPGSGKVPFPEYLTREDKTDWVAYHIIQWLHNDDAYAKRVRLLERVRSRFATTGASKTAAEYILANLPGKQVSEPSVAFRKAA